MNTEVIAGQPSWRFASDKVDAAITEMGGHLAPVRFHLDNGAVEPFSIAPWSEEELSPEVPPILQALRGDFFCAPFGGNDQTYCGEQHPPHGESANAKWHLESLQQNEEATRIHLSLETQIRKGRVDKFVQLRKGQTAIYYTHVLSGMSGRLNIGHHAMLRFPDAPDSGRISTSRIRYGQVAPLPFELPANRGYSALKTGAKFTRLDRVPLNGTGTTDLSVYPARRGFEDLVMLAHQDRPDFAWTAVAFAKEGYVWFSLKNPRVLQSTIFWISNGGRHYAPWNGRHVNVMGLEDVTSYFHYGLKESAEENEVARSGFATCVELQPDTPLHVNYIMGVAAIPHDFGYVKKITPSKNSITLLSSNGQKQEVPVDADFLKTP